MKRTKAKARSKNKRLPAVRVDFPTFRTEAEEAKWWDAHPEVITKAFEQAYGKPGSRATQPVTIRLPVEDVAKARRMAVVKGLRYQTIVKTLLHEALAREAE